MSKSLGNTLTIDEALNRWRPEAIRTFVLSSHYTSPVDFSDKAVEAAFKGWQRLWSAVVLTREQMRRAPQAPVANAELSALLNEHRKTFFQHMKDDFNAPAALATLQELTRHVNSLLNESSSLDRPTLAAIDATYRDLGGEILGIIPDTTAGSASQEREDGLIRLLIELRNQARAGKDWATADKIRDQLKELGIALEDRPDGTVWKSLT